MTHAGIFHVVGCGRFGQQAAMRLGAIRGAELVLVDADPERARRVASHARAARIQAGDGITHVEDLLRRPGTGDIWIIPTLPVHLAAEVLIRLTRWNRKSLSALRALPDLPGRTAGTTGDVYSTLADFVCPPDCPGPEGKTCVHTGAKRDRHLHEMLEGLVLHSRQLAPGVGGYTVSALQALKKRMDEEPADTLWVSTASCCHGVTTLLGAATDSS